MKVTSKTTARSRDELRVAPDVWAIVALKSAATAKSRMGEVLDSEQRRRLFFSMAGQAIDALQTASSIAGVSVVTSSPEVADFAHQRGAHTIEYRDDGGTAAAFDFAVRELGPKKLSRVLMVSGDLPFITADAIEKLIEAAPAGAGVVAAPDRHGSGTNALLCSPPDVIKPSFGVDSLQRHIDAAVAASVEMKTLYIEEIELDLDEPEDVVVALARIMRQDRILSAPPLEPVLR